MTDRAPLIPRRRLLAGGLLALATLGWGCESGEVGSVKPPDTVPPPPTPPKAKGKKQAPGPGFEQVPRGAGRGRVGGD